MCSAEESRRTAGTPTHPGARHRGTGGQQRTPRTSDGRPTADPRRALGMLGEDLAASHLRALGFEILARNVRTREGEIDLVVFASGTLVFVEVKTRRAQAGTRGSASGEGPLAGLGVRQRLRLRRLATAWLSSGATRPPARSVRFDAIGVTLDGRGRLLALDHLEDAW